MDTLLWKIYLDFCVQYLRITTTFDVNATDAVTVEVTSAVRIRRPQLSFTSSTPKIAAKVVSNVPVDRFRPNE